MSKDFADWIVIIYISFQAVVTLCVSIAGAIYVRKEFVAQKQQNEQLAIQIETHQHDNKTNSDLVEQDNAINNTQRLEDEPDNEEQKINEEIENKKEEEIKSISKMNFIKLWFKIVWKMRSVYTSFMVHVFDVMTDVLVLLEWWDLEERKGDIKHINPRIMAICGITVLLFHKFIATLAFWVKEKNIIRCLMQFMDLLIFEELYVCHKRIVTQFRNQSTSKTDEDKYNNKKKDDGVETTMSFKFVRNLEAVFESIPQSILQIVFIIRSNGFSQYDNITLLVISIISIIQSIVSMANAILKNDNTFMVTPKFKKHKQRLPPTIPFLKHALSRVSEIISRIGLFALFWSVAGGMPFGILLGIELFMLLSLTIMEGIWNGEYFMMEDIFLRVQALIVLPSELVYAFECPSQRPLTCLDARPKSGHWTGDWFDSGYIHHAVAACIFTCCCCYWPSVLLSTCCQYRNDDWYIHPSFRIGTCLAEWLVLILWALIDDTRTDFLISPQHGLYFFIVSILCFFIYSQYLILFPNFALPQNVNVRSRFGYALNGELEELQRIKPKLPTKIERITYQKKEENDGFGGKYEELKKGNVEITTEQEFWDLAVNLIDSKIDCKTTAMFALANNHQHVVKWLETSKEAVKHKIATNLSVAEEDKELWQERNHKIMNIINSKQSNISMPIAIARTFIDPYYKYFDDPTKSSVV